MSTEIQFDEKIKVSLQPPKMWKVIFLNDDHTPMDFVIALLVSVFRLDHSTAIDLTLKIHHEGSAVAGTYSYEIAEQKVSDATALARSNGHPLVTKLEQA